MPRKSRELRLSQTTALIAAYEDAGLGSDRNCSFARDMERLLKRKKGLSPKRRAWLDSIIEEGVPAPKGDTELLARVEKAWVVDGMTARNVGVLKDFAGKIRRGWNLSEKQTSWLNAILKEADHLAVEGPWCPADDIVEKLKLCAKLKKSRNSWYWTHKPGEDRAVSKVSAWLIDGDNEIDEWSVKKCLHSFRGDLKRIATPRHNIGDMAYHNLYDPTTRTTTCVPVIVVAGPYVSERGAIVYDGLAGAEIRTAEKFDKRRTRSKDRL